MLSGSKVLKQFGFQTEEEPNSIYPFSPVYRVKKQDKEYIVKKTQKPIERAERLIHYTKMLKESGIAVVTPVHLQNENPQTIDEDVYIVYPFIDGKPYTGTEDEIFQAGKLLGEIHRVSPKENNYQLPGYEVFDFTKEEVEESVQKINTVANKVNVTIDHEKLKEKLLTIVAQQEELKEGNLSYIATPHDFKANNLIYNDSPYLIDPDNASWVPKIFDLALVLLLFHNEHSTAPNVIFTPRQWGVFLSGYELSSSLTETDKANWTKALEHVFLDEVMWLLAECEEDWFNPAQVTLFSSLLELLFDTSAYPLTISS